MLRGKIEYKVYLRKESKPQRPQSILCARQWVACPPFGGDPPPGRETHKEYSYKDSIEKIKSYDLEIPA